MVLLESPDHDHHPSFPPSHRAHLYSHSDSMASMCGSPEPSTGDFAVPSSMSDVDDSEHGGEGGSRKRDLIPARKQREFTPDTRKDDTYWDRRRRNNEAAKRSREKRRMNDMVLETRVMELTTENQWLKAELTAIRDKCGIHKDAPPLVNPNAMPPVTSSLQLNPVTSSQAPPMPMQQQQTLYSHQPGKDTFNMSNTSSTNMQMRTSPLLALHHHQIPSQFLQQQQQSQAGRVIPVMHHAMHPALMHPSMANRMLIPNPHMYLAAATGGMMPQQYAGRMAACQSVSPLPRSSSSGSRQSPCGSLSDPRENGGAVSPSIAAVSSLLKLANSHFNGYPHLPREEDSDVSDRSAGGSNHGSARDEPAGEPEVNNHLPLKLRHKTRIEYEPSPSPPMSKSSLLLLHPTASTSSSSHDEEEADDTEASSATGGYSGEDSAVDVTEHESRKRKSPAGGILLQTENVQLRGELQRLASEVANLKVMMKNPGEGNGSLTVGGLAQPPPAKKQRKSRSRR